MQDQCPKVHPVPRTKRQPRLKIGHEPLGRRAVRLGHDEAARLEISKRPRRRGHFSFMGVLPLGSGGRFTSCNFNSSRNE
jgi:hypothetical protein